MNAGYANTFRRLQEIFGGNAVSDEYGIGRHVANLFVTQTYEGQSDIHGQCYIRNAALEHGKANTYPQHSSSAAQSRAFRHSARVDFFSDAEVLENQI